MGKNKFANKKSDDDPFLTMAARLEKYGGDMAPFEKNFYKPISAMVNRSEEEIAVYRSQTEIKIEGGEGIPGPMMHFTDVELPDFFLESFQQDEFEYPTPIQSQAWPICLSGKDLIGIARTGSGKTLGFILPALIHIKNQAPLEPRDGPIALILAPTRELAQQIHAVAQGFRAKSGIRSMCLFGGDNQLAQNESLKNGAEICIATPGRLIDLLGNKRTNMRRCTFLCLDEADRMLDMGFEPQIRGIIQGIRPDKQTLMFSATWPDEIKLMAADYMVNPVMLRVGSMNLAANKNIKQIIEVCSEQDKVDKLATLLDELLGDNTDKMLIFVQRRFQVDELFLKLNQHGWPAMCIHGDKPQTERDWVLRKFRRGKNNILIATDVAARGLDVHDIKYVVNFDSPETTEDYVHRIGRTGRGNRIGTAYTFFTQGDRRICEGVIKVLKEANQAVIPELYELLHMDDGKKPNRRLKATKANSDGGLTKRKPMAPYRFSKMEGPDKGFGRSYLWNYTNFGRLLLKC